MSGGDTLIVKDGIYTGENGRIKGVPSGSSGKPTVIKAENDFGAILSGVSVGTSPSSEEAVINLYSKSYVNIEGFLVKDAAGSNAYAMDGVYLTNSDHCKLRKIGVKNGTSKGSEYGGGVRTAGCSYCLLEDIFVCGYARYSIVISGGSSSHHNILRRCVVRWDFCNQEQPRAGIAIYGASQGNTPNNDILLQNCIVLDSNNGGGTTFTGGFSVPHETSYVTRYGCISLNNSSYGLHSSEDSLSHDNVNVQCIVWDSPSGMWWRYLASGMSEARNCTTNARINGGSNGSSYCRAVNNLMVDGASISNMSSITGTQNISSSQLTYLLRSPISGVGATIEKKMGVDGTIWGETGYNTLTDDNLWPWPYEDAIKALFSEPNDSTGYSPSTNDTTRGFCSSGKQLNGIDKITLTSYLWEYLGHQMPSDIYSGEDRSVDEGSGGEEQTLELPVAPPLTIE